MAIVTEISWDDIADPAFDNPARKAWRTAVAEIAEKAKATLPQCNGRVESAVKMVLAGDVELLADGKAKVASQSNGTTAYFVVNGECQCKDFPKAPSQWCKHRIAAGIQKRAYALAKQKLVQLDGVRNGTSELPAEQAQVQPQGETVSTLPEAPASANVHVTLHGRQVQVTLRDSDEQRLLERLEKLLQRFPVEDTKPEGWCTKHNLQMKEHHKDGHTWHAHKLGNTWCHGK